MLFTVIFRQKSFERKRERSLLQYVEKKNNKQQETHAGCHTYPISFGEKRRRHKEQGHKVETFLQLILPVILSLDFCFAFLIQKLDAQPAIRKPCHLVMFTQEIKVCLFQEEAKKEKKHKETLTLDIEGGVGGLQELSRPSVHCDALEVPCVQSPVHGGELEVAAFLESPLGVFKALSVVKPAVSDVSRIAHLAAEHGAAAMQGILGLWFLGKLDGRGLD